ncbi:uncharacterized protein [Paramisgurnus dabryanus]|uniref:uncharacterized protein n=1 Tax=Paramisgurnus dabryanus TaxID=90735 RepID=UPI0031F386A4
MPRTWVRKTERGVDATLLKRAAEEVMKGKSVRAVAKSHKICHVTLNRYWLKYKELKHQGSRDLPHVGYYSPHQVFTREQEETLSQYISQAADIYYGLTPREVRKFAYQLAVEFNIKHPQTWNEKKMAGPDWFSSFMKRNPRLSVRSPQATSLSRATSFNRANVELFFNRLREVIDKNGFDGSDIWNVDETSVTTVQAPSRVVARRGVKQVGAMTSGERGTLVSVAYAVQALGNTIPPFFVFPRKNFKDHFVQSGPLGSAGSANSSGWMQEEDFLSFLVHFVKHTKVSPERKVLLLLDNHSSHISVRAVDFCKGQGIVLLTFPPHCSHKLQPLDRSVFGPFKRMVNSASDDWMRGNPGKTMSIYDIPAIVRIALPTAATQKNIQAGFQCTGIWPYNCNIFQDCDFMPSQVTDRPDPSEALQKNSSPSHLPPGSSPPYLQPGSSPAHLPPGSSPPYMQPDSSPAHLPPGSFLAYLQSDSSPPCLPPSSSSAHLPPGSTSAHLLPGPSSAHLSPGSSPAHLPPGSSPATHVVHLHSGSIVGQSFSPSLIRPFPKAGPRKETRKGRKKRRSEILTDTPVKLALEEEERRKGKIIRKKILGSVKSQNKKGKKPAGKRVKDDNSSSEEEDFCVVCMEPFRNSRSKEVWVKCVLCSFWAHQACTPGLTNFICHHCDSE